MRLRVLVIAIAVAACTDAATINDPEATAVTIVTFVEPGQDIDRLRVTGTVDGFAGVQAFQPGVLPESPRELGGRETAVVLLPESYDGSELAIRIDALAGDVVVRSGGGTITVVARANREIEVVLGEPAICGDGVVRDPLELCDDANTGAADGCSDRCTIESGFVCDGAPSSCRPFSTGKDIHTYAFGSINNPGILASDVQAEIVGTLVAVTVPNGTNVTALVATFSMTGADVTVNGTPQIVGVTANDFTGPVVYRVVAEDGTSKDYIVMVGVAGTTAKELTAFGFATATNPALNADIIATITGTTINAVVPAGTTVTALVATFSTTGVMVTVGGTAQSSGATANNFTAPVVYRVTAANNSTLDYTVTVTVAAASAKEITAFDFLSVDNPAELSANVIGSITGTDISLTVPAGTGVTSLVASFATSGTSVRVGAVVQTSSTTPNDFTSQVVYTVTAADASTKNYTVTVTVASGSDKDITSYEFSSANNAVLSADAIGTINGNNITVTVPSGTNVGALTATFSTTGVAVRVGSNLQVSGQTPNNFTSPVTYTVTAGDASTKNYTVTVTVAGGSDKDITEYSFFTVDNPGLSDDVDATINGTNINVTVPIGTNLTALKATFQTTGVKVQIGAVTQVSGQTTNNFSSPKTYVVTAADASTKSYTVTVTEL